MKDYFLKLRSDATNITSVWDKVLINPNTIASRRNMLFYYLLTIIVLFAVVLVRVRLLEVPLERDEGEYAYMGQLILKGIPPFVNAYTMKLPGVSMVYALFMLFFGQTQFGIHLGLLIINLATAGLVWLLARRLFETQTATTSAIIYLVLSLSQGVFGVFAHATHFVNLFALAGFVLLLQFLDNRRMSLIGFSGLCFGLAVIMKQHAAILVLFAFLYLVLNTNRQGESGKRLLHECILFLLGSATPLTTIVLWLAQVGVIGRLWFWTVKYSRDYISAFTFSDGLGNLGFHLINIVSCQFPLWVSAIAGFFLLRRISGRKIYKQFLFGFSIFSFLAICPGFHFRPHYFILILPAIAILAGYFVTEFSNMLSVRASSSSRNIIPTLLLVCLISYGVYKERLYFFILSPVEVSRDIYYDNPFPESLVIARYLKTHTAHNDRIAILGSEPQIYFYADRLSATGHIYMYGLMEDHPNARKMQLEMINEIEAIKPVYIVKVSTWKSWPNNSNAPKNIRKWANDYIDKYYKLVGIADISAISATNYRWDEMVVGYVPRAESFITIYKRTS